MHRLHLGAEFASAPHALAQLALEVVPDLVIGLDRLGQLRFVNREVRAITGYADDELIGKPFVATLVPEELQAACHHSLAALLRDGTHEQRDPSVIRTRAGQRRDIVWMYHRLPHEVAPGVVILVVGRDVTEERLASQRVLRQQKLLAIGTLAAGLAHEIRNPLNAAQLHIALLKRLLASQETQPETMETIDVVGGEIKRLAGLVSEFLAFAEPRPLVKVPMVVQTILGRAVAAMTPPSAVAIEVSAPREDLAIIADPERIELVIRHVLDNALAALAPRGVGEIHVRARREPQAMVVEIEDDGPGLPSPGAPVFDAFFSTKPNGSGLGLAVSHRIVTDHGGTLDVESRPGRTCFRIVLPLDEAPAAPARPR